MTDWYQTEFGAPAGDLPVPEVGNSNGLDQGDLLLLEEMLGESYPNCDIEDDVQARRGRSPLSEDNEHIHEGKLQHSVRFASSVASQATGKSNASAKYDSMTGEDESRIGANVVARFIGSVDLEDTDNGRFDEFKDRIHYVPEAMDEMKKKRGFSALTN